MSAETHCACVMGRSCCELLLLHATSLQCHHVGAACVSRRIRLSSHTHRYIIPEFFSNKRKQETVPTRMVSQTSLVSKSSWKPFQSYVGSHSVTCHRAQVNVYRLNHSQAGWYSIYLRRRDGRLS